MSFAAVCLYIPLKLPNRLRCGFFKLIEEEGFYVYYMCVMLMGTLENHPCEGGAGR
jgi:hypothetical protein